MCHVIKINCENPEGEVPKGNNKRIRSSRKNIKKRNSKRNRGRFTYSSDEDSRSLSIEDEDEEL